MSRTRGTLNFLKTGQNHCFCAVFWSENNAQKDLFWLANQKFTVATMLLAWTLSFEIPIQILNLFRKVSRKWSGGRDIVLPSFKAAISALFRIRTKSCWQNFITRKTQGRFGSVSVLSICRCAVAFDLRIASLMMMMNSAFCFLVGLTKAVL